MFAVKYLSTTETALQEQKIQRLKPYNYVNYAVYIVCYCLKYFISALF